MLKQRAGKICIQGL